MTNATTTTTTAATTATALTTQSKSIAETFPEFDHVISLVINSVRSVHSKRQYTKYLTSFLSWVRTHRHRFSKATVNSYRQHLQDRNYSNSTINGHLSAIRKLAIESADAGIFSPDVAAAITRAPGMPRQSRKTGRWLTKGESEALITAPDPETAVGARDRAILALLIGCGLRRAEVAGLVWSQFQVREGRYVLLDVFGKGDKIRTVPVPTWAAHLVSLWRGRWVGMEPETPQTTVFVYNHIFPGLRKGKSEAVISHSLTPQSIRTMVIRHAQKCGLSGDRLESIAAHDLRRTFAKLARKNGADLEQIQFTLGHASLTTTELYLGGKQNLQDAPCDVLGINITGDKLGETQ